MKSTLTHIPPPAENEPYADFELTRTWFKKAADNAKARGMSDSFALWMDGLAHLNKLHDRNKKLAEALHAIQDRLENQSAKGNNDLLRLRSIEIAKEALKENT